MRVRVGIWSAMITAACGGSSGTTGVTNQPPAPPATPTQTISMTDYAFSPAAPTIKAGTIVKWVNNGNTSHTATSDGGVAPTFDSGTLAAPGTTTDPYGGTTTTPGGAFQVTFSTPGTYTYHCTFHGVPGSIPGTMKGTITVTQ
jgi:plastocyanin